MSAKELRPNDALRLLMGAEDVLHALDQLDAPLTKNPRNLLRERIESAKENAGFNGWTNYETWCVHLWLTNDEASYNPSREIARESEDAGEAAQALKEFVEDANPYGDEANLYTDLLNAALSPVNWYEIAEALREDPPQEPQEPEEGDLITYDHAKVYQDGKLVLETTPERFAQDVKAFMDGEQFWPNIWFISDHGNAHLLTNLSEQDEGNK
jgi:hypothetical protein